MTNREKFIKIVQQEIFDRPDIYCENYPDDFEGASNFFTELIGGHPERLKVELTENGAKILSYMQTSKDKFGNTFTAKIVADGISMTSRAVSGSMRKLVTEGFIQKVGTSNPVTYELTEKGEAREVDLS